jgi:predicted secreted protein
MLKPKIILWLGMVVASVSALRAAEPGTPALVKVLTQKDNGAAVTLTLKSRLMIRLPAQSGTGFSWTPKASSSLLRLVKSYEKASAHMLPGGIATEVFRFHACCFGYGSARAGLSTPLGTWGRASEGVSFHGYGGVEKRRNRDREWTRRED